MTVGTALACRACGHAAPVTVLSLGETPLANSLLTEEMLAEEEETFPLDLAVCPACTLVQITETVAPEKLFRDYVYFSSFSDTMLSHARALVEETVERRGLGPDHLVVEAASNDGYLLQFYAERGVRVLGVEPAVNIARVANERGIETIPEFFDAELARRLAGSGRQADVFHAHNVLAHVADLNGFVEGIGIVLPRDGIGIVEAPYVKDMLDRREFDTIYHEHLCYFSLTALDSLFARHGLTVVDVERVPVHGGSLRVTVAPAATAEPTARPAELLAEEAAWGVRDLAAYRAFAGDVRELESSLVALLRRLKSEGATLAAYGAAAKGSTLLNVFGIGDDILDFVVDRSPVKQGRYMPGVRLPIEPPERLLETMPDYVLILAWNLADEVIDQQGDYRLRGGRFIVPVPEPTIL